MITPSIVVLLERPKLSRDRNATGWISRSQFAYLYIYKIYAGHFQPYLDADDAPVLLDIISRA